MRARGVCGDAEAGFEIERRLVALARSRGPLRAVLARVAARFVKDRAWERLGYARPDDHAAERLGCSGRALRDWGAVGRALDGLQELHAALVAGKLGWTKVRLVARVASAEDEARWIAYARRVSALELAREVRKLDQSSVEAGALEDERDRSRLFELACSPQVHARWFEAWRLARQVHGDARLSRSQCAEMIAAEALSALPTPSAESEPLPTEESAKPETGGKSVREVSAWRGDEDESKLRGEIPAEIVTVLEALDSADAFELDARLRRVIQLEQRMDAQLGPLLAEVLRRRIHTLRGYPTVEGYVREQLGLEPSWGRALLRIERAAAISPELARAYRSGEITALQAAALALLIVAELAERWIPTWLERARGFTLRRLRDDVERALSLRETSYARWCETGGLPDPTGERAEVGSREIGAIPSGPRETSHIRLILDVDVSRLVRAVLCSVRRQLERETGRLPTPGEAFGAMLEHALETWGATEGRRRRAHAVFERDGWRCTVPGCSSMRNLHEHHVVFRSAGGEDAAENLVTLCAFHHLRGVHAGVVHLAGRAPDRLRIALGVRPGGRPLALYASGDRKIRA